MNDKYKGGLTIFAYSDKRKQFPDYFLLDQEKSSEKKLWLLAYDANLCPSPNIDTWNPAYIEEVCGKICDKLKEFQGVVYLDGILLNREKRQLED